MNHRRRRARLDAQRTEAPATLPANDNQDIEDLDKSELIKLAWSLGINASSRWKETTIRRKIKETEHA